MSAPNTTTAPRQWRHCVGSNRMHYFTGVGVPLCGAVLTPDRPLVIEHGRGTRTDAAPKCRDCDRAHNLLWRKRGAA